MQNSLRALFYFSKLTMKENRPAKIRQPKHLQN